MQRLLFALPFLLISCYPKINIEGFDEQRWNAPLTCQQNRLELAQLVVDQEEQLLSKGQAEIKALLGQPDEHELYTRNQKFFHYNLNATEGCNDDTAERLSILFDALDRAKEVMITE